MLVANTNKRKPWMNQKMMKLMEKIKAKINRDMNRYTGCLTISVY